MLRKTIFVELVDYTPLPPKEILEICAAGSSSISYCQSKAQALENMCTKSHTLIVSNAPNPDLFATTTAKNPKTVAVLYTKLTMKEYCASLGTDGLHLVDHIVAAWEHSGMGIHYLRITLQKIIRGDYLGIEKYLLPCTDIQSLGIANSSQKEAACETVAHFAHQKLIGPATCTKIRGICEELLLNAIYDAFYATAKSDKRQVPSRKEGRAIAKKAQPYLYYACDGQSFAVSVRDPFGQLNKKVFFQYLAKLTAKPYAQSLIDSKKEGAGLGLMKVLFGVHSIVATVLADKVTEVSALLHLDIKASNAGNIGKGISFFTVPDSQPQKIGGIKLR